MGNPLTSSNWRAGFSGDVQPPLASVRHQGHHLTSSTPEGASLFDSAFRSNTVMAPSFPAPVLFYR